MPRASRGAAWLRGAITVRCPIPTGTSAVEFLTDAILGFTYYVEKALFTTKVAGTGAGASRTLQVLRTRGTTDTVVATGTITLAGTSDLGEQTALTVTDDGSTNEFLDGDKMSVDLTAAGTQFTAGEGELLIVYRQRPQQR